VTEQQCRQPEPDQDGQVFASGTVPPPGNPSANGAHEAIPQRPVALSVVPDNIPAELRAKPQWVVWRYEWKPPKKKAKGKWDKPPSDAHTGRHADSTDPKTWASFEDALRAYTGGGWDGVGFVPTPDDGLGVLDLDKCRDRLSGEVEPWAQAIVAAMDTYAEVSPSGTGLRIPCRGRKPGAKCKKGRVEIFDGMTAGGTPGGKYLTFTGHRLDGAPADIRERQQQLEEVYRKYLDQPKQAKAAKTAEPDPDGPGLTVTVKEGLPDGPLTDEDIVRWAEHGTDAVLTEYWRGGLNGKPSDSEADAGLCSKLLWLVGSADADRVDRLFRQSGRMRPKWDERRGGTTWGRATIDYAVAMQAEYRQPRGVVPEEHDAHGNPQSANAIIVDYFRERYQPVFRRGECVYAEALRRDVGRNEATQTPEIAVIVRLAAAVNAPKNKKGGIEVNKLPGLWATWAKVAWGTLYYSLPDEDQVEEVTEATQAAFRETVARGLLSEVTIGHTQYENRGRERVEVTRHEKRPVLYLAQQVAKGERWSRLRDYPIWGRLGPGEGGNRPVEVAIRSELFAIAKYRPLADLPHSAFARRCEHYAVGHADRAGGVRVVVLAPDFLSPLWFATEEGVQAEPGSVGQPTS
jgi:hypothetical protein